jgi:predicted extracellular nuclease
LKGYFLQDARGLDKSGIFVLDSINKVDQGQVVLLEALVDEYYHQTVLRDVKLLKVSSYKKKPHAKKLRFPLNDKETFEGAFVEIKQKMTLTDAYSFLKYGQLELSAIGILQQPTEYLDAQNDSLEIKGLEVSQMLNSIIIDDISNQKYPEQLYAKNENLRLGAELSKLRGYFYQRNERYFFKITDSLDFKNVQRSESINVEGELNIMVYNLHNLFNGDGQGEGFPTARGAKTFDDYQLQLVKLANAIKVANPDVLALVELENDGEDSYSSIIQLAEALNSVIPSRSYRVAESNLASGRDAIKLGIIYDENRISTDGLAEYHSNSIFSRAPIFQKFTFQDSLSFVLNVNHFKSKSPRNASGLNLDQGDGQVAYNHKRVQQAESLIQLIDSLYADENMLIVGDLNAYTSEDPIQKIEESFTRLNTKGETYVYKGRAGVLDHAFVNTSMSKYVHSAQIWSINALEPAWMDYRNSNADSSMYRSSDHNPLLIGLY